MTNTTVDVHLAGSSYSLLVSLVCEPGTEIMSQSPDNTEKPTAVARLYLEDGTVLTGISFGSHVGAEGEVRLF